MAEEGEGGEAGCHAEQGEGAVMVEEGRRGGALSHCATAEGLVSDS